MVKLNYLQLLQINFYAALDVHQNQYCILLIFESIAKLRQESQHELIEDGFLTPDSKLIPLHFDYCHINQLV